jgi:hypothetical protein
LVGSLKLTGGECFVHFIMKPEEALVSESVVWKTDVISADKVVETNGIQFKLVNRNKFKTFGECLHLGVTIFRGLEAA